jgi:hypothetical protein
MVCFATLGTGCGFYLTPASVIAFGALALVAGGARLWHGISGREFAGPRGAAAARG